MTLNVHLNIVKTPMDTMSFSESLQGRAVLPDHGLDLLPYTCGCLVAHRRGSLRVMSCPQHGQRVAQ